MDMHTKIKFRNLIKFLDRIEEEESHRHHSNKRLLSSTYDDKLYYYTIRKIDDIKTYINNYISISESTIIAPIDLDKYCESCYNIFKELLNSIDKRYKHMFERVINEIETNINKLEDFVRDNSNKNIIIQYNINHISIYKSVTLGYDKDTDKLSIKDIENEEISYTISDLSEIDIFSEDGNNYLTFSNRDDNKNIVTIIGIEQNRKSIKVRKLDVDLFIVI